MTEGANVRNSWGVMLLPWLWLVLLWLVGSQLPRLAPWAWLLAVLVLAALPAWGLWLAIMLRKKVLLMQFVPQGGVWVWFAGPWWPAVKAFLLALALVTLSLWQAYFIDPWEWGLLCAAPLVYWVISTAVQKRLNPEFVHPAFAWSWSQTAGRWSLMLLLGGLWIGFKLYGEIGAGGRPPPIPAEQLDESIASIAASRSGLVRWGLDTLLALHLGGSVLRDLPQQQLLRLGLLILIGPGVLLPCLGAVLRGASGLQHGVWHAARFRDFPDPRTRAAVLTFIGVLTVLILLPTVAAIDGVARQYPNPLALQRLPECERIDGHFYRVGTSKEIQTIVINALGQTRADEALCSGAIGLRRELDKAVERYLDWYFSLDAEWARIFHLLTDGADDFLRERLQLALEQTPGLSPWLQKVQELRERGDEALETAPQRIVEALARQRLKIGDGECLVKADIGRPEAFDLLGDARQRLGASAVAGVSAGAFAGLVAAKAMSKAGMKAAAKALAKVAVKQGMSKAVGAAVGAAVGSVVPGPGTAVGALAGGVLGVLVGVSIDWAALQAEEHYSRDTMRADLHEALYENLRELEITIGCASE